MVALGDALSHLPSRFLGKEIGGGSGLVRNGGGGVGPRRVRADFAVGGVDADAAQVGVLAVLVVLEDLHLQHVRVERVAVGPAAGALDGHLLPADRVVEVEDGELDQVVLAGAGLEDDLGGRVGLVLGGVDVEADVADPDPFDEVDGQLVRLRAVGPMCTLVFIVLMVLYYIVLCCVVLY